MDKFKNPLSNFKKTFIINHEQNEYFFDHRNIYDAIEELLNKKDIISHCQFNYSTHYKANEQAGFIFLISIFIKFV